MSKDKITVNMNIYDIPILVEELEKADKENKRLNNIIVIMEKYFELIVDLGYDYDGLNSIENLKGLIDELVRFASLGRVYNTTEAIYVNEDKKYNILNEELKEEIQRQSKALCINDKLLLDYRDRLDKAIEYLNEPNRDEFDYSITYLLEILQGGDE